THFVSLMVSSFTIQSTTREPLGNMYFISPNFGLDWMIGSSVNFYIRGGPALRKESPGGIIFSGNIDLGLGWIF
ncbi:MAG TPA: hypothetical protein VIL52_04895, partial [Bacteroidota bacterium]